MAISQTDDEWPYNQVPPRILTTTTTNTTTTTTPIHIDLLINPLIYSQTIIYYLVQSLLIFFFLVSKGKKLFKLFINNFSSLSLEHLWQACVLETVGEW